MASNIATHALSHGDVINTKLAAMLTQVQTVNVPPKQVCASLHTTSLLKILSKICTSRPACHKLFPSLAKTPTQELVAYLVMLLVRLLKIQSRRGHIIRDGPKELLTPPPARVTGKSTKDKTPPSRPNHLLHQPWPQQTRAEIHKLGKMALSHLAQKWPMATKCFHKKAS